MPLRPNMQPQEFLEIFLRRKWLILFSIMVILFGASVYCVVTPELFRSSTTILVVPQRVPENYVRSTVSTRIEDRVATIRQQVLSRTRLVSVMDELGIFKDKRKSQPVEVIVEMMRNRISIETMNTDNRHNDAFTLSFVHENPQTAMLTTSRLASFFIDENLKTREQQAVGTAEFLDSQLQETKKKLEEQEERVKKYKSAFMGELPQELQANLQMLSRMQDQLRANAEAIRVAQDRKMFTEAQVNSMEMQISTLEAQARAAALNSPGQLPVESISPGDPAAGYAAELNLRKTQLANLSVRYTDKYPEIRRLKDEIAQLEKRVAETRGTSPAVPPAIGEQGNNSVPPPITATASFPREREELQRLRAALKGFDLDTLSLKKERKELERNINMIESKVSRSPKREQEMVSLTRDYENLRQSYEALLRNKLDADVSQNLEKRQKGEQFQILDPANLPENPFVPNRPKVFGIALMAALLIGFGGAIGMEAIAPAARGLKEFRHFTEIPVLAVISNIQDTAYDRKQSRKRTVVFGGLITITLAVTVFLVVFGEKIRTILQWAD